MSDIVEKIDIAKDFTDAPGARYITDGEFSGEQFFVELLEPKFISAKEKGGKLFIDFDNSWGYPSSFLSESFGRLSRKYGAETIRQHLSFKSNDDAMLIRKVYFQIDNPEGE